MSEVCGQYSYFEYIIDARILQYHDRHTISRLIGAAPGYVGFEEGGMLFSQFGFTVTLNTHCRPAHGSCAPQAVWCVLRVPALATIVIPFPAVILLDELEKAHKVW
jgi:hypothetical protein